MSKHKHNHDIRCADHLQPMLTPERAASNGRASWNDSEHCFRASVVRLGRYDFPHQPNHVSERIKYAQY